MTQNNLMLTAGSDTGIRHCFDLFVNPGGEVVVLDPTFAMVNIYCQLYGAQKQTIGYDSQLRLDLERMLAAIGPKTELVIIANPNRCKIGQGVVIRDSHVIAMEDLDGTDAMLNRANILLNKFAHRNKRKGILLKFPKRNQDLRVDLPTVGIKTVKKCAKIGLKGIVLKANQNIILDRLKCINLANKNRMFICAI